MKYTAQAESRVANIFAECYICHETLIKSCSYISYKQSSSTSALSVLLYFTLTKVQTKYSSLVILMHLSNREMFCLS